MTGLMAVLDLSVAHWQALEFLLNCVPPLAYFWALTGSAGLRLQGVDIPVHDLDIQAEEKTVYLIEKQLAEFMHTQVHPWESTGMRSLAAKAEIEGIEIELLANISHRKPDGTWCSYTDSSHRVWIGTHGLQVPVFPLQDELEAYQAMGRKEKVALIRQAIKRAVK